jgi:ribosomal-protein-serine acetyltransferase
MNLDVTAPISRRLETERLLLRCGVAADAPAVHAAIVTSWVELSCWMDWAQGPQPTVEETMARLATRGAGFEDRSDLTYLVFEKAAGSFVGTCSLFRFDWNVPRGEIGYWLATNQTKNGYAIEAVNALTTYAWALGLARVEIRCDVLNCRSRGVAERASYPLEGILKNECRNPQGALRDTCVYARVPANDAMRP